MKYKKGGQVLSLWPEAQSAAMRKGLWVPSIMTLLAEYGPSEAL